MAEDIIPFKKKEEKKELGKGHVAKFWDSIKEQNEIRKKKANFSRIIRNKELIEAVERGESVSSVDSTTTLWPKRPAIEKDKSAIKQLFGEDEKP
jgi:hypothetical protein